MSRITVWFIRSSLAYFGIGVVIGICMVFYPGMTGSLRFIHVHLNLLGWISMMIFGVSYHIFPRFSGKQLWSEPLAMWHLITANMGLIGMAVSYPLRGPANSLPDALFIVFSILEAASVFMFLINMFATIRAEV